MYKVNTKGVKMIEATDLTASELVRLYGNSLKKGETYTIKGYCKVEQINNSDGTVRVPEYTGVMFVDSKANEVIIGIGAATGVFFEPTGNGSEVERKQINGSCLTSTADIVAMFDKKVIVKDFQDVKVLRYQTDKVVAKKLPIFVKDDEKKSRKK